MSGKFKFCQFWPTLWKPLVTFELPYKKMCALLFPMYLTTIDGG